MRTPLIAGNWKMHGTRAMAAALAADLVAGCARRLGVDLAVCPPFPFLDLVGRALHGSPVALGAQDCHGEPQGAHTGEVSAEMLAEFGCRYVIVGHSERRARHHEDDPLIAAKLSAAWRAGLTPILCIGETLAEREDGAAETVVTRQLTAALAQAAGARLVIAYEPVWAIGTGRVPQGTDIVALHGLIRRTLAGLGIDGAATRVLYGGSVKPDNAGSILALPEVDGALVGGACLDPSSFLAIARALPVSA